jgi:antitoxin component of RelBE/YafQ-DinJ toxin-antitoxin module
MESRRLSIRVPDPLLNQLQSYLDQQGLTVTEGVLAAIASYVGDNERLPLVERVSRLEKRLAILEGKG